MRQQPGKYREVADLTQSSGLDEADLQNLLQRHFQSRAEAFLAHHRLAALTTELQAGQQDFGALARDLGWHDSREAAGLFHRHSGLRPSCYRDLPRQHSWAMDLPSYFGHDSVLAYLGRDAQSLYERVHNSSFRFALRSDAGAVQVAAEIGQRTVQCRLSGPGVDDPKAAFSAHRLLRRYLGLSIDPTAFEHRADDDPLHRRLLAQRRGLSIPQTPSVFDGLVWVVAGQQVSLAVAFVLRRRLGHLCGTQLDDDLWLPPTAAEVAAIDLDTLRANSWSQRKAEYVLDLATAVRDGDLDLEDLQQASTLRLESTLMARRGLGPWSVAYLMMRSFGLADCVPVGDAALKRNLRRFFELEKNPDVATTLRLMQPFAPFRSLATFHFWAHDKNSQ